MVHTLSMNFCAVRTLTWKSFSSVTGRRRTSLISTLQAQHGKAQSKHVFLSSQVNATYEGAQQQSGQWSVQGSTARHSTLRPMLATRQNSTTQHALHSQANARQFLKFPVPPTYCPPHTVATAAPTAQPLLTLVLPTVQIVKSTAPQVPLPQTSPK
jgi:hypothetical protein